MEFLSVGFKILWSPNILAIAAPNDEKEDFTSDGRNDAYTIASYFSAVNNSMAFTETVQLVCSDISSNCIS
jgi:hypothetical protein